MMKQQLTWALLAIAAIATLSCSKEDPTAVNVNTRATITGLVRGNTDLSNDFRIELIEVAPGEFVNDTIPEVTLEAMEGVRIFARYNTADLTTVSDPGHVYEDRITEAVSGEDGRYTITLPAGAKSVAVMLSGTEMEIDRVEADGRTERKTFTTSPVNTTVSQNVTRVIDFTFSAN